MKAVFLDRATFPTHIRITPPAGVDSWLEFDQTNDDQVLERCQNAQIILTNKVKMNRSVLEKLHSLKLICVTATGMNNIDLDACRSLGIQVVNATNYGTASVAEHVLMLLLNLARNQKRYQQANDQKSWSSSPFFCDLLAPITQLSGRTLTIIGKGTLGMAVAERAKAFGMKILYAEHQQATILREGYTPFTDALQQADFLSLHCPLNEATHHLLNEQTLQLLKPTAFVINAGRGPLVDEAALLNALTSNRLAGAALDVAEQEPPSPNDTIWSLAELDNVIVTPHIAWGSNESMQTLIEQILSKIENFLSSEAYP